MKTLRNNKGQTSVEYLLLLAVSFIAAYAMIRGPIATFTQNLITDLREGLVNVVEHAEWTPEQIQYGTPRHPASDQRLQPLHL